MADNQPGSPRESGLEKTPSGAPAPLTPVALPNSANSPALTSPTAEEFAQFQQFQRFQQFTQQEQALQPRAIEPPPPTRPPAMPRWVKRLLGKILSILITIILLVIAGKIAYNYFFPSSGDSTQSLVESGGGKYHTNRLLSKNPYQAVRSVYDGIGKNDPNRLLMAGKSCGPMREDIQQKFADNMGFPDCAQAAYGLAAQVTNLNAYIESIPSYVSTAPEAKEVTIFSCQFTIQGGPSLGTFVVTEVENGQWLIIDHSPDPAVCPPSLMNP